MTARERLLVEALRAIIAQCDRPGGPSLTGDDPLALNAYAVGYCRRAAATALERFNRDKRVARLVTRMRSEHRATDIAEARQ